VTAVFTKDKSRGQFCALGAVRGSLAQQLDGAQTRDRTSVTTATRDTAVELSTPDRGSAFETSTAIRQSVSKRRGIEDGFTA
jgi:hypothetical protein